MPRLNETDTARREAVGNGGYFVEALARGLSVIRAFSRERSSMTLSDAARFTSLPKPTVRRVLLTLVDLGYAETDGRVFRLSPQVMSLAVAYLGTDLVVERSAAGLRARSWPRCGNCASWPCSTATT